MRYVIKIKGFGTDLAKKFPNGGWKTINGARVFIDGGKVKAGLGSFNGMIDDFFKEEKPKTQTERFDLDKTTDVKSMIENIRKITKQYGNSKMAVIEAWTYINEFPEIAKQLLAEKNIKTKQEFNEYAHKEHTKSRKGKKQEYKEDIAGFNKLKTEIAVSNILKIAHEQNAEWDKRIAERYAKN